ncbi:peptidase U32 family protein [Mailhella massiliensis]|uniref:U32 family peptidase n=1 Tax=Mailhella massiliensis TaxID=1903261 RepID=A0A921DSF5_9BACT|nr:peptidase U32 family protein [Mailhella massiliensis]HJD98091.1 U32 family peptidase [Mailhella massiliensis]
MKEYSLPELLAPAGGREQLEAAVLYGADAVYLGGSVLSLRAKCQGFDGKALEEAVRLAHEHGVKVYYCLNALPFDEHLPLVEEQLDALPDLGVDGLIAADPGVIRLALRRCPGVELHLSTQAHSVNASAVEFWSEVGVKRINLARELSKEAMESLIRRFPSMDFEIFVHGAMCLSLSGHCLISAWVNNRPANLGLCTQPCRFEYRGITLTVEEALRRDGPFLDIEQGEDFSAVWAPMDLCLVRWMEEIVRMHPAALKLEGRTKSGSYVAQVTDVYRTALSLAGTLGEKTPEDAEGLPQDAFVEELLHTASRPLCSGFFLPERVVEKAPHDFSPRPVVARVVEPGPNGGWQVEVRSPWNADTDASLLLPGMRRPKLCAGSYVLENHRGEKAERLNPGMHGTLYADLPGIAPGIYLRA